MSYPEGTLVLDGRFRIIRSLGKGGMGEVYLGEQVSLARKVALKVLHKDVTSQPAMLERFRREALLLSTVDHPSVVRVIDFGNDSGHPWIVMDLVEGRNLRDVLDKEGPIAPERALRLLQQLADGLAAIHEKGIIHRDLKPENVILTQATRGEQARLLDFGIARLVEPEESSPSVTQDGLVLGTPEYVSPEQAMGHELDARSDIYSFAVLAYRMLTGRLPFDGPLPRQFMAQHAAAPPKHIEEANPALKSHPALCALLMRCLEKDARNRPQRADEVSQALEAMRIVVSGPWPAVSGSYPAAGAGASPAVRSATDPMGVASPAAAVSAPMPLPAVSSGNAIVGTAKSLALMLTDIKGFTERTSRQTREENAMMLKDHDTVLHPIIALYGGAIRQKRGDALLVTFTSPTEAVLCGMGIQDALYRFNEAVPAERRLNVRVCVHVGEVFVQDDAIFGEPVKAIEQVEGVADGGEVCFTEVVRLQMNRAEVPHTPRGELTFAGAKMPLYKATPEPQGLPFGGRDVRTKSLLPSTTTIQRVIGRARNVSRRAMIIAAAAVLFLILVGVALSLGGDSTAAMARDAIEAGRPKEAINIIELAEREKKSSPALKQLKAIALHGANEHGKDLDALQKLGAKAFGRPEKLLYPVLAQHYSQSPKSSDLRDVMGWVPKEKLHEGFEDLLHGPANDELWGALRYLDLDAKSLQGSARVDAYARALQHPDCDIRDAAITRLEKLGDASAADELEKIKPPERSGVKGFFGDLTGDDCGQSRGKKVAAALRKK